MEQWSNGDSWGILTFYINKFVINNNHKHRSDILNQSSKIKHMTDWKVYNKSVFWMSLKSPEILGIILVIKVIIFYNS